MALIDIEEPRGNKARVEAKTAIGIDFGTTHSLAAFSRDQTIIIKNENNDNLTKSIVSFGNIELKSIKRILGRSYAEIMSGEFLPPQYRDLIVNIDGKIKLKLGDTLVSPLEIAAKILERIRKYASTNLQETITACVLTVPAHFDEIAKNELRIAADIAGLDVLRIISESTAACYAYGLDKKQEGTYIVYDFGGGTFDVSVLEMKMGVFKVIGTGGDNLLGGDDIDIAFKNYLQERGCKITVDEAQSLKEQLSSNDKVEFQNISITRTSFEQVVAPIIAKTINITNKVLYDTEIHQTPLGIILVGGSSRIPIITEKLQSSTQLPLLKDHDPDIIVASGAAIVARNLTYSNNDRLIIDITPLSLGIEVEGGLFEKIIHRNSSIPCSVTKTYSTGIDNQTAMKFHILQGERELIKDCRSIGFFELKNIKPQKAGIAKIDVKFVVDTDSMLSVYATDSFTGNESKIEILPKYGISENDIINMLKLAYSNAKPDHEVKLFLEAKARAEKLVVFINESLSEFKHEITENLAHKTHKILQEVDKNIKSTNTDMLNMNIKELQTINTFFVDTKLDRDIMSVIKGKNIKELEGSD